jgi:hypothetical protein
MDFSTLKKKLSTYESDKGYLKNASDDVLYEVLVAWENWTGPGGNDQCGGDIFGEFVYAGGVA